MDILVIGCGVCGLTSALRLLEAGHQVTIWGKTLPPDTTSNLAAAVWFPYKAYPIERVIAWSKTTFDTLKTLLTVKSSGVEMMSICELLATPNEPWWQSAVDNFRHARTEELPDGYADGYMFEAPRIDTAVFLAYLMQTFKAGGGQIVQRTIGNISEAFAYSPIVINCSGLGAREMVGDHDLHAARGQVVKIRPTGYRRALLDEEGPNSLAYIVPRTHDIVLGGTYEEHNYSTNVDPQETLAILRRCAAIAPEFAAITPKDIISVACGLRPVRSTVRVEAERAAPDHLLIHNYGHGGAGITLCWGCATEVVDLVTASLQNFAPQAR